MIVGSFLASFEKPLWQELWEYILETYLTPKYGYYTNINIDPDPGITPAAIFFAVFVAIMAACAMNIFNRRTLGRPVRLLLRHDAIGRGNAKTLAELGLDKPGVLRYFINRLTLAKAIRCVEEDEFYGITEEESPEIEVQSEEPEETPTEDDPPLSRADYKKKLKREKREAARNLSDYKVAEIGSRSKNAYYVAAASKVKYKRNVDTDHFYIADGMQYRAEIRFSSKGSNPIMLVFIAVGYVILGVLAIRFLPTLLSLIDGALGNFK